MKNLISIFAVSILLSMTLTACGDDPKTSSKGKVANKKANNSKGEVIIKLDGKSYTILLNKCFSLATEKGNSIYQISTKNNKVNKEPFFFVQGAENSKQTGANYSFILNGDHMAGGTTYSGEMPFNIFKNNKISFKGEASSFSKGDGINALRGIVPIEFNVTCNS